MAMQSQLWSISALATELNMDRRTMAKRLEGLPPAEIKKTTKRVQKLWRLKDVIEHLKKPRLNNSDDELRKATKEYLCKTIYPSIVDNDTFIGTIFKNSLDEGLTKHQALRQYEIASYAILSGICALVEDEDLQFETGHFFEFLKEHGNDYFIKNHWPEEDLQQAG